MLSFYYCYLIARQQRKYIQKLKRYLNLVVNPNPNLLLNDDFDIATHNAVLNFKRQFNRSERRKVFIEDGTISNTLWEAVWTALWRTNNGIKIQTEELKTSDTEFKNLILGLPFIKDLDKVKECDKKLAGIFGGAEAVVATIYDPIELKNPDGTKHSSAGKARPLNHTSIPWNGRVDVTNKGGVIHLYTNEQGLPDDVGVYVPQGFTEIKEVKVGNQTVKLLPKADNQKYFFNKNNENPLYIVYAHVKTVGAKNIGTKRDDGAIKIGDIGGPGGYNNGSYVHCHIVFYSKYTGDPQTSTTTDPRDYFCI